MVQLTDLTKRQREVVSYLASGMSTKRIATEMDVSPRTIDHHLYRIGQLVCQKRGLKRSNAIIAWYYEVRDEQPAG